MIINNENYNKLIDKLTSLYEKNFNVKCKDKCDIHIITAPSDDLKEYHRDLGMFAQDKSEEDEFTTYGIHYGCSLYPYKNRQKAIIILSEEILKLTDFYSYRFGRQSQILCKLQNGNIICFTEAEIDLLNFCLKYTVA